MGIMLDIVAILILIISVYNGYKDGMVKVVFGIVSFFIAIIVSLILYTPVTNFIINNTEFDDKIEQFIIVRVQNKNEESVSESSLDNYIEKYSNSLANDIQTNVVESATKVISNKIVSISVIILIFILTKIILIITRNIIEGIASLPILKQFNELGGFVYGILRAIVIIYVVLAILFVFISFTNNEQILRFIDSSIIVKFVYANNIIINFAFSK